MTLLESILQQVFPRAKYRARQPHYRAQELKGELRAIELPASVTDQLERLFKHLPSHPEERTAARLTQQESRRG